MTSKPALVAEDNLEVADYDLKMKNQLVRAIFRMNLALLELSNRMESP